VGTCDEDFPAVDPPVIPLVHGPGLDGSQDVGAAARLGESQGEPKFPLRQPGQVFLFLFRCSQVQDHGGAESRYARAQDDGNRGRGEFLVHDHRVHGSQSLASVLLRHLHTEVAELPELVPQFIRDEITVFVHPPDVFAGQLFLAETLHFVAQYLLFFGKPKIHDSFSPIS